jgi:hypothetical protein
LSKDLAKVHREGRSMTFVGLDVGRSKKNKNEWEGKKPRTMGVSVQPSLYKKKKYK